MAGEVKEMAQVFEAVFEDGVLKPLERVDLADHQHVRVAILPSAGVVKDSQGMIRIPAAVVEEVAGEDEYGPWEPA